MPKLCARAICVALAVGAVLSVAGCKEETPAQKRTRMQKEFGQLLSRYVCPVRVNHSRAGAITKDLGGDHYEHVSLQSVKDGNRRVIRYCEK